MRWNMTSFKYLTAIICFTLGIFLLVAYGCTGESGYKHVDFSKTIDVAQPEPKPIQSPTLRVAGAAMISPKETFVYYKDILDYIGKSLGHRVQMIQRKTYGEINELFPKRQIDIAFICTGPYAVGKKVYGFEALATPIVRDQPFYHSYLIVNKASRFKKIEDLRGQVFAYTDPDSNTGALVPNSWLLELGQDPASFFKETTFTYSHDNSILAVAKSLVDGAAVDSHIWEYYHRRNPYYTSMTRVIRKSKPFGSPPLVASVYLSEELKNKIQQTLVTMHDNDEGRRILQQLMIDRFETPREEWYRTVLELYQRVHSNEPPNYASQNS